MADKQASSVPHHERSFRESVEEEFDSTSTRMSLAAFRIVASVDGSLSNPWLKSTEDID
jgi:hypothetical protein